MLSSFLKKLIYGWLQRANIELRSIDAPTRSFGRGLELLSRVIAPKTVIDIGVANGTPELYQHFPAQKYLLVEASPQFSADLERISKTLPDVVIENVFCGSQAGTQEIRLFEDGRKSSMYQPLRKLKLDKVESVPVATLDSLISKHDLTGPFLVKVDVEGAELEVIKGSGETLKDSATVILESSVAPRFGGGPELADLVEAMSRSGFALFDILAGTNDPKTQNLKQVDLVFVQKDAPFRL